MTWGGLKKKKRGKKCRQKERRRTTLRGDNTPIPQRIPQQLKVRLLEKTLRRALRVRAIGDNNIKLILAVLQELKPITNVDTNVRVLEANAHAGQVFLGDADDGLVDVAEDSLLDGLVLDDFAEDTAVAAADDEDFLGVGVGVHGEVGDHFLVAVRLLIPFITD